MSQQLVHYFNPEYQLSMSLENCTFYGKASVKLWCVQSAVRDDGYLSEAEIAEGKTGWMVCGTLWFHENQETQARQAFIQWRDTEHRPDKMGISHDDLPASDEVLQRVEIALSQLRSDLMHFPPNSAGRLLLTLREFGLNTEVRVQSTMYPLVSHPIAEVRPDKMIDGRRILTLVPK